MRFHSADHEQNLQLEKLGSKPTVGSLLQDEIVDSDFSGKGNEVSLVNPQVL